jgi:hypothetical protein
MEFQNYKCPLCGALLHEHGPSRCLDAWAEGLRTEYEIIPFTDLSEDEGFIVEGYDELEGFYEYVWEGDLATPVPYYSPSYAWEDLPLLVNEFVRANNPFRMGMGKDFFAEAVIGPKNMAVPQIIIMPGESIPHAVTRCYIYWKLYNGAVFSNDRFKKGEQDGKA